MLEKLDGEERALQERFLKALHIVGGQLPVAQVMGENRDIGRGWAVRVATSVLGRIEVNNADGALFTAETMVAEGFLIGYALALVDLETQKVP